MSDLLSIYSCQDEMWMTPAMIDAAAKGICAGCRKLIPLRANGEIETHSFGAFQCGGTGQPPRKDEVPIPLPSEPPRDRVIEAVDADGRVFERWRGDELGDWLTDGLWFAPEARHSFGQVLAFTSDGGLSLRHVPAEEGETS